MPIVYKFYVFTDIWFGYFSIGNLCLKMAKFTYIMFVLYSGHLTHIYFDILHDDIIA